jgi:1,4-dihydroxy-2-naphthoate polyprenyltransferase
MILFLIRWFKASRVLSYAYLALPLFLGQFMALPQGPMDWLLFGLVMGYGFINQLFIIYANDYADAEADAHNTNPTLFSGGSRVIQNKELTREQIGIGAMGMAFLMVGLGVVFTIVYQLTWSLVFILLAQLLLWMYNFPPVKLAYRGLGEILPALGMGVLLPLMGYYLQTGGLHEFPWYWLPGTFLLTIGITSVTALPDYEGDRIAQKRSLPVLIGFHPAKIVSWLLIVLAVLYLEVMLYHTIFISFVWYVFLPIPLWTLGAVIWFPFVKPNSRWLVMYGIWIMLPKAAIYLQLAYLYFLVS